MITNNKRIFKKRKLNMLKIQNLFKQSYVYYLNKKKIGKIEFKIINYYTILSSRN